jgi:hypothetical protein
MPPQELGGDRRRDVSEPERALLFGHARMKDHLEQKIAELVLQIIQVATLDRVRDLVGFLDGVRRYAPEVLCQVPGTAAAGRA